MSNISELYSEPLTLLNDLYQLTMAYGYWKSGHADREAVYHLFYRKAPFQGQFAIACGLPYVIDYVRNLKFSDSDVAYLATLNGADGKSLFEPAFLDYLQKLEFTCDIDAVHEGTPVFPQEPMVRVRGPLIQCQLLETPFLNIINFQTLIATKASRIREAAGDRPVIEFGLRRAHGYDGAVSGTRAAYIGGADGTSNVLAGKLFGIPVKGTHAHSWVMSFDSELEAFHAYADAMPNNCVFLVDTYDSMHGVDHAIEVAKKLEKDGHHLQAIRLDSGDLAYLSVEARQKLDAAGLQSVKIMGSNDLDEHIISNLNMQGAKIDSFGVGTKLITAFDQPALGGVYKLGAVRDKGEAWQYKLKLSEQQAKISNPGVLQVRRFLGGDGHFVADAIYDAETKIGSDTFIVDPFDVTRRKVVPAGTPFEDLLTPIFREGRLVYKERTIEETKAYCTAQLGKLHPGIRRLLNPHRYPAGLELDLHDLKLQLVLEARGLPV
jgi:nicotinate phosphoribosyltransferase